MHLEYKLKHTLQYTRRIYLPESWLRPAIAEEPPANHKDLILLKTTEDQRLFSGTADVDDTITGIVNRNMYFKYVENAYSWIILIYDSLIIFTYYLNIFSSGNFFTTH